MRSNIGKVSRPAVWLGCVIAGLCLGDPGAAAEGGVESSASGEVLFEDRFEGGLAEGWTWLRENPDAWRFRDGALEIRLEPGNAQTVKNALVRPAPDRREGRYAFEVTVTMVRLTQQYEQAGITWYTDGKPVFKIVKELVDGELCIIPGRSPMDAETVQLRLIVDGERWIAQFRPDARGEFLKAAEGELPPPGDDQVSIQGYHGPPDAEHWVRFEDFRILRLDR
jgi:hypothetical protein